MVISIGWFLVDLWNVQLVQGPDTNWWLGLYIFHHFRHSFAWLTRYLSTTSGEHISMALKRTSIINYQPTPGRQPTCTHHIIIITPRHLPCLMNTFGVRKNTHIYLITLHSEGHAHAVSYFSFDRIGSLEQTTKYHMKYRKWKIEQNEDLNRKRFISSLKMGEEATYYVIILVEVCVLWEWSIENSSQCYYIVSWEYIDGLPRTAQA